MKEKDLQSIKLKYGVIGKSPELDRAIDVAVQVAPSDLSVLIVGESGVGKEIIPRIIHENSARKHKKYIAINCGSIPEGTIDSELFGHDKGAFTGAVGERDGYFGAADGGTLFLDEVGELPMPTQARLLRVLETGEFIRVGSNTVRKVNVRIVAATNVNIVKAIREGRFREDLYYRLNTIPIKLPPLRERGEDVVLLFRKFAADMSEKYSMPPVRLDEEAKEVLMSYSWPGNIRELKNLTERMSVISEERLITKDILLQYITPDEKESGLVPINNNANGRYSYDNERDILLKMLFELKNEVKNLKDLIHDNVQNTRKKESQSKQTVPAIYIPRDEDDEDDEMGLFGKSENAAPPIIISSPKENVIRHDDMDYTPIDVEETPLPLKAMEEKRIIDALRRAHGNRKKAAKELGISDRTLYRKIKEYGVAKTDFD